MQGVNRRKRRCGSMFRSPVQNQQYPIYMIDPILFAFPCSCIALVIGSYMTQDEKDVEKGFVASIEAD